MSLCWLPKLPLLIKCIPSLELLKGAFYIFLKKTILCQKPSAVCTAVGFTVAGWHVNPLERERDAFSEPSVYRRVDFNTAYSEEKIRGTWPTAAAVSDFTSFHAGSTLHNVKVLWVLGNILRSIAPTKNPGSARPPVWSARAFLAHVCSLSSKG